MKRFQNEMEYNLERRSTISANTNFSPGSSQSTQDNFRQSTQKSSPAKKRKKSIDHKINPNSIPRPNYNDYIYKNEKKKEVFTTDDSLPPHSNSFYKVVEKISSSPRFIRSTLVQLPLSQDFITDTKFNLGVYVQPFAEILSGIEKPIPKVEVKNQILRCGSCRSYVNNRYFFKNEKNSGNKTVECNLCNKSIELDINKTPGIKTDYIYLNYNNLPPELEFPSIDFSESKSSSLETKTSQFKRRFIFLVDISTSASEIDFSSYIMSSINANAEFIYNASNTFLAFLTYNHNAIQFYQVCEREVKVYVVNDIESPFCPVPGEKLFINAENKRDIERLVDKVNYYASYYFEQNLSKKLYGSVAGAAVYAAYDLLKEVENCIGTRIMLFNANGCFMGYGSCRQLKSYSNCLKIGEDVATLYEPQHQIFQKLGENCLSKKIAIDIFSINCESFDLMTFSSLATITGGNIKYYSYEGDEAKQNFEKIHYDLSRLLTHPLYYNLSFTARCSKELEILYSYGIFNRIKGPSFSLSSCDSDFSYSFTYKIKEKLNNNRRLYFQVVVLFTDSFGETYLRVLNLSVITQKDNSKLYSNIDVDALTKLTLIKEIAENYETDFKNVAANLEKSIINLLTYYRKKYCDNDGSDTQLILPSSMKLFPLYLNSFIKKPICYRRNESLNKVLHLVFKFLREPVYHTIKFLYPRLYRLDNIKEDYSLKYRSENSEYQVDIGLKHKSLPLINKPYAYPLSMDSMDFDTCFLLDNGEIIRIFIFSDIEVAFMMDVFGLKTWRQMQKAKIETIGENGTDLNTRILNIINQLHEENFEKFQPLKFYLLESDNYDREDITVELVEDAVKSLPSYIDFLCSLHTKISDKMKINGD